MSTSPIPRSQKTAGVLVVPGLWPGKPAAVQGLGATTAPPGKCPVRHSLQPMLHWDPGTQRFPTARRPCDYTSQVNRPSSPKSPPTPTHGNIRSHLARSAWGGLRHIWRHPRHRVVPATSGCVLKAEARVGGFCSWLGSGKSIKTQIGNRVSVLPLRGDSPTPPAGYWGLGSGFLRGHCTARAGKDSLWVPNRQSG